MMRGVGVASRGGGGHFGITICEKPPALAALSIVAAKCQEVAAATQFSCYPHLQDCLGVSESHVFKVKKLLKGIYNWKTDKSETQNRRN